MLLLLLLLQERKRKRRKRRGEYTTRRKAARRANEIGSRQKTEAAASDEIRYRSPPPFFGPLKIGPKNGPAPETSPSTSTRDGALATDRERAHPRDCILHHPIDQIRFLSHPFPCAHPSSMPRARILHASETSGGQKSRRNAL